MFSVSIIANVMIMVSRLYRNVDKLLFYLTIMTYVNLLNQLPNNGKSLFRKLENSNNKLIKTNWSKTFNEVCLKENILPVFTN